MSYSSSCYNSSCVSPAIGALASSYASAVQFFAAAQCLVSEGIYPDTEIKGNKTYDFIIIGGGSTGSVLANRLSEVKHWNILLIEGGGDPPIETAIPGFSKSLWPSKFDYDYHTKNNGITNQANINGSLRWPRGKMLGGCSNNNYMIYIQGTPLDYVKWCQPGKKEWCGEKIKLCFKKSTNLQDMKLNKNPAIYQHYGHNGPLIINSFNYTSRANANQVLEAFQEIDINNVPDLNVANVMGSGILRATASSGIRNSVSRSYLRPITNRKNLHIKKNTMVTRILINQDKKAFGVEIDNNGEKSEVYATKDIIVSAGVVNSPYLLMSSGIGPSEHLKSKNVTPIVDLPMVGGNLKDHLLIPIIICTNESIELSDAELNFDIIEYLYNHTGLYAQIDFYDILAFYSLDSKAKRPDFQIYLDRFLKNTPGLKEALIRKFQYKASVAESIVELNRNYSLYLFYVCLLHPVSSGHIYLDDDYDNKPPVIVPNYFNIEIDMNKTISGMEKILTIMDTKFFKSVGAFPGRIKWPACDKFKLNSREYLRCINLNLVGTVYHPIGTCRMGTDESNSVVSSQLKVHGIKNLRVADASVMPDTVSGNTNGPCVMIGECAAEIIKEDYNVNERDIISKL